MKNRHSLLLAATFVLFTGVVTVAGAESDPEDVIKYRKSMMKAIGGHMAASAAIINGKVNYKGDLADHARAIQALTKDVAGLFPKDSDFGDTDALEAVWKKPADFKKRAGDAKTKAAAFAKVAGAGDMVKTGAAFKELNDACKACHKDFRKEQK